MHSLYYTRMSYCSILTLMLKQENLNFYSWSRNEQQVSGTHLRELLTPGKSCSLTSSGGFPRFSSLATLLGEHRALNSSKTNGKFKTTGKLFPFPQGSGPPHTSESQKVNYSALA